MTDRDMNDLFLRSFPIVKVSIRYRSECREFYDPDDATVYLKELFDSYQKISAISVPSIYRPVMTVEFAGDLHFTMPVDDPRQMTQYVPQELREQIPEELLENNLLDDFVRQTSMIRLMLSIYKNHVEGNELVPDEFKFVFYDNLLRTHPENPRAGFEELSEEEALEFDEMMQESLIDISTEMIDNYPPALRRQLEEEFDLPRVNTFTGTGYKFYDNDDFV